MATASADNPKVAKPRGSVGFAANGLVATLWASGARSKAPCSADPIAPATPTTAPHRAKPGSPGASRSYTAISTAVVPAARVEALVRAGSPVANPGGTGPARFSGGSGVRP